MLPADLTRSWLESNSQSLHQTQGDSMRSNLAASSTLMTAGSSCTEPKSVAPCRRTISPPSEGPRVGQVMAATTRPGRRQPQERLCRRTRRSPRRSPCPLPASSPGFPERHRRPGAANSSSNATVAAQNDSGELAAVLAAPPAAGCDSQRSTTDPCSPGFGLCGKSCFAAHSVTLCLS